MLTTIKIRSIDDKIYNILEFTLVDFYFPTINGYIVYFQREVYIINDLNINALININILYLESQILDLLNETTKLIYNLNLKIKLEVVARGDKIKRYIVIKVETIISPRSRRLVLFVGQKDSVLDLLNHDILFKLSNESLTIFAYIISANTIAIIVENDIDNFIILLKYTYLSII